MASSGAGAPARGVNENSFNGAYLSAAFIETVQEKKVLKIIYLIY